MILYELRGYAQKPLQASYMEDTNLLRPFYGQGHSRIDQDLILSGLIFAAVSHIYTKIFRMNNE